MIHFYLILFIILMFFFNPISSGLSIITYFMFFLILSYVIVFLIFLFWCLYKCLKEFVVFFILLYQFIYKCFASIVLFCKNILALITIYRVKWELYLLTNFISYAYYQKLKSFYLALVVKYSMFISILFIISVVYFCIYYGTSYNFSPEFKNFFYYLNTPNFFTITFCAIFNLQDIGLTTTTWNIIFFLLFLQLLAFFKFKKISVFLSIFYIQVFVRVIYGIWHDSETILNYNLFKISKWLSPEKKKEIFDDFLSTKQGKIPEDFTFSNLEKYLTDINMPSQIIDALNVHWDLCMTQGHLPEGIFTAVASTLIFAKGNLLMFGAAMFVFTLWLVKLVTKPPKLIDMNSEIMKNCIGVPLSNFQVITIIKPGTGMVSELAFRIHIPNPGLPSHIKVYEAFLTTGPATSAWEDYNRKYTLEFLHKSQNLAKDDMNYMSGLFKQYVSWFRAREAADPSFIFRWDNLKYPTNYLNRHNFGPDGYYELRLNANEDPMAYERNPMNNTVIVEIFSDDQGNRYDNLYTDHTQHQDVVGIIAAFEDDELIEID